VLEGLVTGEETGLSPSTLLFALRRGELAAFEHRGRLLWNLQEVQAWASPEGAASRRARAGRPRKAKP